MVESFYKTLEPFWGVWHIDAELGSGSFGKVFKIKREEFGEVYTAALKVITVPTSNEDIKRLKAEGMDTQGITEYYRAFLGDIVKEFSIMSNLKGHSNVVSYEDHMVVEHPDGMGWDLLIRMELLTPLDKYLISNPMDEKMVITLGIDMCKALETCARYNIIHRDIKPDNVFVSEFGNFKLGDFGVARTAEKATQGMSLKGTINYMAPEVYKREKYNATVDIYSLGIMLYRLSNNNRGPFLPTPPNPITYSDQEQASKWRMNGEPLPDAANAGPELMAVIRKAAAYKAGDRYAGPAEFREALEGILYGETTLSRKKNKRDKKDGTKGSTWGSSSASTREKSVQSVKTEPSVNTGEETMTIALDDGQMLSTIDESNVSEIINPEKSTKEGVDSSTKKESKGINLFLVAAVVIVICVAGIFFLRNSKKEPVAAVSETEASISNGKEVVESTETSADTSTVNEEPKEEQIEEKYDFSNVTELLWSLTDGVMNINPLIWKADINDISENLARNGIEYQTEGDSLSLIYGENVIYFDFEFALARRSSKLKKIRSEHWVENEKNRVEIYGSFLDNAKSVFGKPDCEHNHTLVVNENFWNEMHSNTSWILNEDPSCASWCKVYLRDSWEEGKLLSTTIVQEFDSMSDMSDFISFSGNVILVEDDSIMFHDYDFICKFFGTYGTVSELANPDFEDNRILFEQRYKNAKFEFDDKEILFMFDTWEECGGCKPWLSHVIYITNEKTDKKYIDERIGGHRWGDNYNNLYVYLYEWDFGLYRWAVEENYVDAHDGEREGLFTLRVALKQGNDETDGYTIQIYGIK